MNTPQPDPQPNRQPNPKPLSLGQLTDLARTMPWTELPDLIRQLETDPRQGGRQLAQRARRRWQREQADRLRFGRAFRYEREYWQRGVTLVAGVDEVGRGPLAGPVVAAAVVLPPDLYLPGLKDSKLLSAAQREGLYHQILAQATAVAVAGVPAVGVDRLNIHQAGLTAMARAVRRLQRPPAALLVDAFHIPGLGVVQQALIGGDRLSNSIAAAAVVAKVHRDRLMKILHRRYPEYGFANHKGYPTAAHRQALHRYGPTPHHRRSFRW